MAESAGGDANFAFKFQVAIDQERVLLEAKEARAQIAEIFAAPIVLSMDWDTNTQKALADLERLERVLDRVEKTARGTAKEVNAASGGTGGKSAAVARAERDAAELAKLNERLEALATQREEIEARVEEATRKPGASTGVSVKALSAQWEQVSTEMKAVNEKLIALSKTEMAGGGETAGEALAEGVAEGVKKASPLVVEAVQKMEADLFRTGVLSPRLDLSLFKADLSEMQSSWRKTLQQMAQLRLLPMKEYMSAQMKAAEKEGVDLAATDASTVAWKTKYRATHPEFLQDALKQAFTQKLTLEIPDVAKLVSAAAPLTSSAGRGGGPRAPHDPFSGMPGAPYPDLAAAAETARREANRAFANAEKASEILKRLDDSTLKEAAAEARRQDRTRRRVDARKEEIVGQAERDQARLSGHRVESARAFLSHMAPELLDVAERIMASHRPGATGEEREAAKALFQSFQNQINEKLIAPETHAVTADLLKSFRNGFRAEFITDADRKYRLADSRLPPPDQEAQWKEFYQGMAKSLSVFRSTIAGYGEAPNRWAQEAQALSSAQSAMRRYEQQMLNFAQKRTLLEAKSAAKQLESAQNALRVAEEEVRLRVLAGDKRLVSLPEIRMREGVLSVNASQREALPKDAAYSVLHELFNREFGGLYAEEQSRRSEMRIQAQADAALRAQAAANPALWARMNGPESMQGFLSRLLGNHPDQEGASFGTAKLLNDYLRLKGVSEEILADETKRARAIETELGPLRQLFDVYRKITGEVEAQVAQHRLLDAVEAKRRDRLGTPGTFHHTARDLYMLVGGGSAAYGIMYGLRNAFESYNRMEYNLAGLQGTQPGHRAQDRSAVTSGVYKSAIRWGFSPDEVAEAAKDFARQGYSTVDIIHELDRTLMEARGFDLTIHEVQDLQTALRAMNEEAEKTLSEDNLFDKLAHLEARYSISAKDLGKSFTILSPLVQQFNGEVQGSVSSLDTMFGMVTAIVQRTRVSGAQAATTIRMMLSRLSNTETLKKLQTEYGIQIADASGKDYLPFPDMMTQIVKRYRELEATNPQAAKSLAAQLGGTRQIHGTVALLQDYDVAQKAATESSYAFADAQGRSLYVMDTLQVSLERFRTSFQLFLGDFMRGSDIAQGFKAILDGISGVLTGLSGQGSGSLGAIALILGGGAAIQGGKAAYSFLDDLSLTGSGVFAYRAAKEAKEAADAAALEQVKPLFEPLQGGEASKIGGEFSKLRRERREMRAARLGVSHEAPMPSAAEARHAAAGFHTLVGMGGKIAKTAEAEEKVAVATGRFAKVAVAGSAAAGAFAEGVSTLVSFFGVGAALIAGVAAVTALIGHFNKKMDEGADAVSKYQIKLRSLQELQIWRAPQYQEYTKQASELKLGSAYEADRLLQDRLGLTGGPLSPHVAALVQRYGVKPDAPDRWEQLLTQAQTNPKGTENFRKELTQALIQDLPEATRKLLETKTAEEQIVAVTGLVGKAAWSANFQVAQSVQAINSSINTMIDDTVSRLNALDKKEQDTRWKAFMVGVKNPQNLNTTYQIGGTVSVPTPIGYKPGELGKTSTPGMTPEQAWMQHFLPFEHALEGEDPMSKLLLGGVLRSGVAYRSVLKYYREQEAAGKEAGNAGALNRIFRDLNLSPTDYAAAASAIGSPEKLAALPGGYDKTGARTGTQGQQLLRDLVLQILHTYFGQDISKFGPVTAALPRLSEEAKAHLSLQNFASLLQGISMGTIQSVLSANNPAAAHSDALNRALESSVKGASFQFDQAGGAARQLAESLFGFLEAIQKYEVEKKLADTYHTEFNDPQRRMQLGQQLLEESSLFSTQQQIQLVRLAQSVATTQDPDAKEKLKTQQALQEMAFQHLKDASLKDVLIGPEGEALYKKLQASLKDFTAGGGRLSGSLFEVLREVGTFLYAPGLGQSRAREDRKSQEATREEALAKSVDLRKKYLGLETDVHTRLQGEAALTQEILAQKVAELRYQRDFEHADAAVTDRKIRQLTAEAAINTLYAQRNALFEAQKTYMAQAEANATSMLSGLMDAAKNIHLLDAIFNEKDAHARAEAIRKTILGVLSPVGDTFHARLAANVSTTLADTLKDHIQSQVEKGNTRNGFLLKALAGPEYAMRTDIEAASATGGGTFASAITSASATGAHAFYTAITRALQEAHLIAPSAMGLRGGGGGRTVPTVEAPAIWNPKTGTWRMPALTVHGAPPAPPIHGAVPPPPGPGVKTPWYDTDTAKAVETLVASQVGTALGHGGQGAATGSELGGLLGTFLPIPGGSLIGSVAGGLLGGLFDHKESPTPVIHALQAIEHAQRETIQTIQQQTDALLNPENRLLNLPASFVLPAYNPAGVVGGTGPVIGTLSIPVTVQGSADEATITRLQTQIRSEALSVVQDALYAGRTSGRLR